MNKDDVYKLSISIPRRIVKVTLIVILSAFVLWIAINTFRYFIMDISYLRSSSVNVSNSDIEECVKVLNDNGITTKVKDTTIYIKYRQAKMALDANLQFNDQWEKLFTDFEPTKAYADLFGIVVH